MKKLILTTLLSLFSISLFSQESYLKVLSPDGNYTIENDISYRSDGNAYARERCKLDIYYCPDSVSAKKNMPVVVWFHGGGLTSGKKEIPTQLQRYGLVVVAVNYRLLPKAELPEVIDDAAAAVAWTFKNIYKYGGSSDRIFVAGHSAGGYLTNMVGLDKKWLQKYGIDANLIAGLIPFSGQVITHFAYRKMKGMKETQPLIDEFAPLFWIRPDAPLLVIISGDRNKELYGRYEETAYFWRMMKLVGHNKSYLYEIQGFDHGSMAAPAFHILKQFIFPERYIIEH